MLKIRDEHMQAFQAQTMSGFEERGVRHLRTHLPEQTAPFSDNDLRVRIQTGGARARTYGFLSERQIMSFVDTSFLIGPDFDHDRRYPWAQEILLNRALPPNRRAGTLLGNAARASGYRAPQNQGAVKEA
jgi:hypothetical protein